MYSIPLTPLDGGVLREHAARFGETVEAGLEHEHDRGQTRNGLGADDIDPLHSVQEDRLERHGDELREQAGLRALEDYPERYRELATFRGSSRRGSLMPAFSQAARHSASDLITLPTCAAGLLC
jgi:hypothetical protein